MDDLNDLRLQRDPCKLHSCRNGTLHMAMNETHSNSASSGVYMSNRSRMQQACKQSIPAAASASVVTVLFSVLWPVR